MKINSRDTAIRSTLFSNLDGNKLTPYQTAALKKPKHFAVMRNQVSPAIPCPTGDKLEDDIEVLCVNCMKMIKVSLAEKHSLYCAQVESEVKLIDQCSLVQQADYKLRKLKESLSRMNKVKQARNESNYYIRTLLNYCEEALGISGFTRLDILKCREIIYNLHVLIETLKPSSTLVYTERLSIIVKEKYVQLLNYYKDTENSHKPNEEVKIKKAKREHLNSITERNKLDYNPGQIRNLNVKVDVISDVRGTE
eukprot:TRINITY_DN12798_c0_g9_i1.p1 TRINITY_DN12798_c0_g9~~TRINITY_DN12798_c0_g9_i1.p1  ORF type:complete len:252 (-),score=83.62 TRINITY_DN12798_c0_g9_i1:572-1327(-)